MEPTIRLRVGYRSVRSLVKEYTASLGRGGCLIVSRRPVAPGARFVIEMSCDLPGESLRVEGEVVRVRPVSAAGEAYELAVQYRASPDTRAALEVLLASIEVDTSYDVVRQAPRIPVAISASDAGGRGQYVLRDLSRGGARIECLAGVGEIAIGDRVVLGIHFAGGPKALVGSTVRWTGYPDAASGLQFGVELDAMAKEEARWHAYQALLALEPPSRVLVHLVSTRPKQRRASSLVRRPRIQLAEVRAALDDVLRREPSATLGLRAVDASVEGLFDAVSYFARVGLRGDLVGELHVLANHALCTAVTGHVLGEADWSPDAALFADALREFAVRLASALCSALELAGFEVETTAPLVDEPPAASTWRLHHGAVLASDHGLASIKMLLADPPAP